MSGPVPLALSLVAVIALIGLAHMLGFTRRGTLSGPDHAALLAQDLPGGFLPSEIILARDGGGAVLRDQKGRFAVVASIGAHFLVRQLERGWCVRRSESGVLVLQGRDFSAELDLGDNGEAWFVILAKAAGGSA